MKRLKTQFEISELIMKYLDGSLSRDESAILSEWLKKNPHNVDLWTRLTNQSFLQTNLRKWEDTDLRGAWDSFMSERIGRRVTKKRSAKIYYTAAIVTGVVLTGLIAIYLLNSPAVPTDKTAVSIAEGHNQKVVRRVELILGNGRVIDLDGSTQAQLTQNEVTVIQANNKKFHYSIGSAADGKENFNILTVPRGCEYQVVLADGTKVWLNAASSLKFPARFTDERRQVVLSGEGYFEVHKDFRHMFIVKTESAEVMVLGTKFNVCAYSDDSKSLVSLSEGALSVENLKSKDHERTLLTPGHRAVIEKAKNIILTEKVDVEADLAWKNAMFIFNNEALVDVMKRLARWYDVNVQFEQGVDTTLHFSGRIEKYQNIEKILSLLKITEKISFDVEGHIVKVVPYKA